MEPHKRTIKTIRGKNVTSADKRLLFELVKRPENLVIIKNKHIGSITNLKKQQVWDRIAATFNAHSTIDRTVKQLKSIYQNELSQIRRRMIADGHVDFRTDYSILADYVPGSMNSSDCNEELQQYDESNQDYEYDSDDDEKGTGPDGNSTAAAWSSALLDGVHSTAENDCYENGASKSAMSHNGHEQNESSQSATSSHSLNPRVMMQNIAEPQIELMEGAERPNNETGDSATATAATNRRSIAGDPLLASLMLPRRGYFKQGRGGGGGMANSGVGANAGGGGGGGGGKARAERSRIRMFDAMRRSCEARTGFYEKQQELVELRIQMLKSKMMRANIIKPPPPPVSVQNNSGEEDEDDD